MINIVDEGFSVLIILMQQSITYFNDIRNIDILEIYPLTRITSRFMNYSITSAILIAQIRKPPHIA